MRFAALANVLFSKPRHNSPAIFRTMAAPMKNSGGCASDSANAERMRASAERAVFQCSVRPRRIDAALQFA